MKKYEKFTDKELEYLYNNCDIDADINLMRKIEKKIRKQIKRYREFDKKDRKVKSACLKHHIAVSGIQSIDK